jgi:hypothetical protein
MATALLASAVPIPTGPVGTYIIPTVATPTKNAPEAEGWISGRSSAELSLAINQIATRTDIASCFAAGFGIIYGLTPTNTNLVVTIAAGQANIYGVAFYAGGTITIPDATARVFIWLKSDYSSGSGTSSLTYTTSTTPPSTTGSAGQCVLLCSCVTAAGTVTGGTFDYSGVVYCSKAGLPLRYTADVVQPSDTPGSGTIFLTQCLAGLFLWDGTRYYRLPQSGVYTATGNVTLTSTQSMARVLTTNNVASYTLTVPKELREWIVMAPAGFSILVTDGTVTVTVAAGKTALVYCDSSAVKRLTADV